ncbi:unnamed protein product [Bursaphelenchus okinawaensis]|uniref:L-dopachrome isomerase n=1 Tax=Bursaphelenchus okinawaensis TaxID=465554 RepID=A0A811L6Y6_9BILA|nr:unnamed protein product [Bursaphelenchus okinawaensis]CAG9119318.1 unnamed protein product [Bursaphelenchus okinawaensis]
MTFAGTEEPCATVTIRCIGNIKDEKHQPVVAGKLTSFIADELKISPERFYVLFHDLAEDDVAYTGIMFPELKKKLGL